MAWIDHPKAARVRVRRRRGSFDVELERRAQDIANQLGIDAAADHQEETAASLDEGSDTSPPRTTQAVGADHHHDIARLPGRASLPQPDLPAPPGVTSNGRDSGAAPSACAM